MSQDELHNELADAFAKTVEPQLEYTRVQTLLLGLLPTVYGTLTFIFGGRLWDLGQDSGTAYSTAMTLPHAPQSWGALFLVIGLGMIIAAWKHHRRCLVVFSMGGALLCATFMMTFLGDLLRSDRVSVLPAAAVYFVLSLMFLNRARLAWAS